MSIWDQEATEPSPERERAGGRAVIAVILGLVVLVGGGYAAAYAIAGENVPRGTTVADVEIGGQTRDEAEGALEEGLADRISGTIQVRVDGETQRLQPDDIGLSIDYAESVSAAGGGRSWNPSRLWDYYTGGDDLDAVVEVDDAAMTAAIGRLDAGLGTPAQDGAVTFRRGGINVTDAVVGKAFDPDATREALIGAYLSGESTAELSLVDTLPDIDETDVRNAVDSFANPALSSPVTLLFDGSPIRLRPQQYGRSLALEPQDGELVPAVDEQRLTRLVEGATSGAGAPVDATVRLVDGKPKVVRAKPGVTFDPADVSSVFLDLVTRAEGKREADVEATVAKADFTTKDARALQIKEQVSEFQTFFPFAEYRNINIGRAAELANGTVLKPGETFSMNDVVGERTRENGFTEGFIISNGVFKQDLGGGVSQLATTLFNGMFFAGLKDVEHKPHSFYIDRYPVGREATVVFGALDLRFQNDTEYGVLVNSFVKPATPSSQGVVTVRMYSTKKWDISSRTSDRYAFVAPGTRTITDPDCTSNSGSSGFQVDVTRVFREAGESQIAREEVFHTDYTPSDTVVCADPPPPPSNNGGGGGGGGGNANARG